MIHFRKERERERERDGWTLDVSLIFSKKPKTFFFRIFCVPPFKKASSTPRAREREREREKEKEKESGTKSSSLRLIVFLKESVQ